VTRRVVGVWARRTVADPGLGVAMLEDVVDLVTGMQQVECALVVAPSGAADAAAVAWPRTVLVEVDERAGVDAALQALSGTRADEVMVVVGDAPDLPPLLLGKLFSALTTWEVAVCPAEDGRLVAVASRLPVPAWLGEAGIDAEQGDAVGALRRVAPSRALHVGAGWHRVTGPGDATSLDSGLEGWEATRAWLSRPAS
jgi:hypothetical protein